MANERRKWHWWQQALLAVGVLVFTFLCAVVGFRRPWIEPLPGVRVEMTRPFVRESDLGPDSAYRLLLEAIRPPADCQKIWERNGGWFDALAKFNHHPWPKEPPSPPPDPGPEEEGVDRFGEGNATSNFFSPDSPWILGQYEDILRLVRLYEPQVALLDRALAAPEPQMPTVDSIDFPLELMEQIHNFSQWLAISAQCKAGTGDFAEAFHDIGRILGLGNLVCRGGRIPHYHAGIDCAEVAAEAAWTIAVRERVPVPVLKDAAHAFLAAADEAEPYVEIVRAEHLAMIRDGVPKVCRDPMLVLEWSSFSAMGGGSLAPWKQLCYRVLFAITPALGSTPENTARNVQAFFQHLIVLAEKPYSASVATDYWSLDSRFYPLCTAEFVLRTRDPLGYMIAEGLPLPLDVGHKRAAERDAGLRGMVLFLLVRAYETEHEEPPETLDALVPDYLPRIPEDPFDGKPFRYLRRNVPGLPPAAWAVYSIGADFTDDGGTARGLGTMTPSPFGGMNPDYVWPSLPYP